MSPPQNAPWYDPFTGWIGGGPLPFITPPVELPPEPGIGEVLPGEPVGTTPTPTPTPAGNAGCYDLWTVDFNGSPVNVCQLAGSVPPQNVIGAAVQSGVSAQQAISWCGCLELPTSPNCPKPDVCGVTPSVPQPTTVCKPDLRVEICNWPVSITNPPPPPPPPPKPQPTAVIPKPQSPSPNQPGQPQPINQGQNSTCDAIDQWASQYQQKTADGILQDFGVLDQTGQIPALQGTIDELSDYPLIGDALRSTWQAIFKVITSPIVAWVAVQSSILGRVCDKVGPLTQIAAWKAVLVWAKRLLGVETRQIETTFNKWENYLCPVETPGIIDADIARRTGDISKDEWRCWVRLNNLDETVHERVYNSRRLQLTPEQLIMLWRRKQIDDKDIGGLLAKTGMISTDDQMRLDQVTQFVPPVTDLIRFTARALGDQDLVQRFKLMEGFDELYTGKLKDWGQANGISDEVMQYYFAGTRQIPAPGQLYTMLQRLRADNVPPNIDPDDWITTTQDLDRALREQHYSPFWWSRLQAISYIPLGIRQLRKPFTDGAINSDQLLPRLKDLGYSPFDAVEYLSALQVERRDVLRKHAITKLYQDAAINRDSASQRLQQEGYEEQEVNDALDYAKAEFEDKSRQKCVEGFRKRYECGEFDKGQLQQELSQVGLDNDQIQTIAARWDCERKSCGKQVSAAQLCSWVDSGLISNQEYYQRLRNVGYDDTTARNIVAECNIKLETRVLAQRERAAKQLQQKLQSTAKRVQASDRQAIAAATRQARELRQLQRQAASDQARANRQALAATDRANRIRSAILRQQSSQAGKIRVREAMLAKAAEAWAIASGHELPLAATEVHQALEAVRTMHEGSADIAFRATIQASMAAKRAKTDDLIGAAREIALAMQEYADVATASVCEQTSGGCSPGQSNGSNAAQVPTSEPLAHPVEPSSGDRVVGT